MTDKQLKICAAVVHKQKLGDVLKATGFCNYEDLQDSLPVMALDFGDSKLDDNTHVTLADFAQEEYDKHIRDISRYWVSITLSIAAIVISFVALLFSSSSLFGFPFKPVQTPQQQPPVSAEIQSAT